jgi:hypothetical protein
VPAVLVNVPPPSELQLLLKFELPVVRMLLAMSSRQVVEGVPKQGKLLLQLEPLALNSALGK